MSEPSRIRRRLGAELRAARTLAGLSQRAFEKAAKLSQTMVSRIERGDALPARTEIDRWLDAAGADADVRERVLALAEAAHRETRPWAELRADGHLQRTAAEHEAAAQLVRCYVTSMVPGLLQTAEYTRQLMPLVDPEGDPAAAVSSRLERQRVLYGKGRRFEFLLAEPALRWAPGPGVMAAQLDRLASLATLATVELAVLPVQHQGVLAWHDFTWWEPPEGPAWVTTELFHGGQVIVEPEVVERYAALWERLWSAAAVGDGAVALIRRMM